MPVPLCGCIRSVLPTIELVLGICQRNNLTKRFIWIFTDNQAAIQRLNTFKPDPEQSTSLALSNISHNLHALKTTIIVQWIPAHTDVPGNELANTVCFQTYRVSFETSLLCLNWCNSEIKRELLESLGNNSCRVLAISKGKNYIGTFCTKPDNIFTSGNCQFISTVTQLRTGHSYFRSYLYKIPMNSVDSPHYPCCCGGPQLPEHLLLRCPLYQRERQ
ncbi:hypothetical protein K440DRAFT_566092 [Wilcoxina mikolae CBS 423.85]|nr:hypothetical protein K440DRAFT_566092 [Wilcoxina mikolae CBS 423.85]